MLSLICLRCSKKVIELPRRTDKIHKLRFHHDEALQYRIFKNKVTLTLEEMETSTAPSYNILAQINSLRQICNLGTRYEGSKSKDTSRSSNQNMERQEIFDCVLSFGTALCSNCETNLAIESDSSELALRGVAVESLKPHIAACGAMLCASCSALHPISTWPSHQGCSRTPRCEFGAVSFSNATGMKPLSHDSSRLPVKIRALLNDLVVLPPEDKR